MESEVAVRAVVERCIENIVHRSHEVTDDSYIKDLGLDSLDRIEMSMDIEDELNIFIIDDTLEDIETVGDLIDAINQLVIEQKNEN
jgi:acyl carrier protein